MFGIPLWLLFVVLAVIAWWRWRRSFAILWTVVAAVAIFGTGVIDGAAAVGKVGIGGVKDTASEAWHQAGRLIR